MSLEVLPFDRTSEGVLCILDSWSCSLARFHVNASRQTSWYSNLPIRRESSGFHLQLTTKTRILSIVSATDSQFFESSIPHPLRGIRLVALPFLQMIKGLEHEPARPWSALG